jgi:hypothetical protein
MENGVTLFASFAKESELDEVIDQVSQLRYMGVSLKEKIFILENLRSGDQYIVTFNVEGDIGPFRDSLPVGSIPIHRKKETNTLYSINALNEIIKAHNAGKVDPTMTIPWEHFANSFLITRSGELSVMPTKIHKVVNLGDEK